jgi:hypothetical protein
MSYQEALLLKVAVATGDALAGVPVTGTVTVAPAGGVGSGVELPVAVTCVTAVDAAVVEIWVLAVARVVVETGASVVVVTPPTVVVVAVLIATVD